MRSLRKPFCRQTSRVTSKLLSQKIKKKQIEKKLEKDPSVTVAPQYVRRATAIPNDPFYSSQWYHTNTAAGIHSQTAWSTQTGSKDIVVAVIDSGIDTDHPDLASNMWNNPDEIPDNAIDDDHNGYVDDYYGYDFVDTDADPNPAPDGIDNDDYAGVDTSVEHGTHVAGIIGAEGNNAVGVTGVDWHVSLMAVRVLNDEGSGTDSDIVSGIQYATANGADVINLSLGGYGPSAILEDAIHSAAQSGVVIVAAAGNDAVSIDDNAFYPACYDGDVIAVSSVGGTGLPSSFSNFANGSNCVVDVAAPGELVYSSLYTNDPTYEFTTDYGYLTGTSMATPVVSGVAALLLAEDSTLDRTHVINLIEDNTRDIDLAPKYGTGLVDAAASLAAIATAHYPTAPLAVHAYDTPKEAVRFTTGTRVNITAPYFNWSGASDIEGIAGYYVYLGKNPNANPVTLGHFQTRTHFQATQLTGDDETYYLRIRTKDTDGHVSADTATFTYLVDTIIPRVKKVHLKIMTEGIHIQWKKLKNQHVYRYIIRRAKKTKHLHFKTIKKLKPKKHTFVDVHVRQGQKYVYRIKAIDDVGNKSISKKKTILFPLPDFMAQ